MNKLLTASRSFKNKNSLKISPIIGEGIAYHQMKKESMNYIDLVLKIFASSLGINYKGITVLKPDEVIRLINNKHKRMSFDISRSDLSLIKINFSMVDEKTGKEKDFSPRYLKLLNLEKGGKFVIGGARYNLIPMLSNDVITCRNNLIFIRLLKNKLNIYRNFVNINISRKNSEKKETHYYLHAAICRIVKKSKKADNTSLVIYLLARYGFNKLFNMMFGITPVIGVGEVKKQDLIDSGYVIISSNEYTKKGKHINKIFFAYKEEHDSILLRNILAACVYTADCFELQPDDFNSEIRLQLILSQLILDNDYTVTKALTVVKEHLEGLETYLDDIFKSRLHLRGIHVSDFYEFMIYILKNYSVSIPMEEKKNKITGKRLEVVYNVYYSFTFNLFSLSYKINKEKNKNWNTIENNLVRRILQGYIFKSINNSVYAANFNTSSFINLVKVCSAMAHQEDVPSDHAVSSDSVSNLPTPDVYTSGTLYALKKSNPKNDCVINPYAIIDENTFQILGNPNFSNIEKIIGSKKYIVDDSIINTDDSTEYFTNSIDFD